MREKLEGKNMERNEIYTIHINKILNNNNINALYK